jgi:hypothetical protein
MLGRKFLLPIGVTVGAGKGGRDVSDLWARNQHGSTEGSGDLARQVPGGGLQRQDHRPARAERRRVRGGRLVIDRATGAFQIIGGTPVDGRTRVAS